MRKFIVIAVALFLIIALALTFFAGKPDSLPLSNMPAVQVEPIDEPTAMPIEKSKKNTAKSEKKYGNDQSSKKMKATSRSPVNKEKTIKEVMGMFDPAKHRDFVPIEARYADRKGLYMQREAYNSFRMMHKEARSFGINLVIRSAARNFDYQKGIWERKWTGKTLVGKENLSKSKKSPVEKALKILEYSSMPGTSRHHWGTDVDFNAFENSYFEKGEGLVLYTWLKKNAAKYGFCQPYSEKGKNRPHGYSEEKWHWSYLPIANEYYRLAEMSLEDSMIRGFQGSEVAKEIGVVKKYVLGINHQCK